ncbi:ferritin-like domain-containing protein [Deinococcus maricopensis]|uniref:Uncharacterized protein n=1 Tax=Deinococcus maricopensis (strain DSM 21211 / LMG 22137 / NRRL B-23946 / LB-34) TaxID=709986 RepID=E8U8V7_DEIML|nr:ferritin-like domain-containing protein [Deinococcus maricopensis]ADV67496.1 protein of unknown function DUF892 [Deinococcus maricopensis DSM 21211]
MTNPEPSLTLPMTDLHDLYLEQLRDVYSAETQLVQALPTMADAATAQVLKDGFHAHLQETLGQVERLERIFADLGEQPGGHTCQAMQGLIAEGQEMIREKAVPAVRDAGLIAAAQRVEHYEIAAYGTVRTYADLLGHPEHAMLLRTSEDEESAADQRLTALAGRINVQAMQG